MESKISTVAERQNGLFMRAQAHEAGITDDTLRGRIARGDLRQLSASVFAVSGAPPTWQRDLLGACLASGPGSVVSHAAAAAWWSLEGNWPEVVEITMPRGSRCPIRGVRAHTSRAFLPVDHAVIRGIPVTTIARTLIDLAGQRRFGHQLEHATDGALRDGLVAQDYLLWRIEELRRPGRVGLSSLLRIVGTDRGDAATESWLERRMLRVLRKAGLPEPVVQQEIRDGRVLLARVDFVYKAERLVIEVDGHRTHSTRRDRQYDAERANALLLRRWRVIRFTYEDVTERPEWVASIVASHLTHQVAG